MMTTDFFLDVCAVISVLILLAGFVYGWQQFFKKRFMTTLDETLGQIAYEAYCEHTGWKSLVSGQELPPWSELAFEIQAAWEAAAKAVSNEA